MQASAASNSTRDEVVRFVCESKLFFMSRPQTMTKASDSGVREQVLVWFERTQRRIFYRDLGAADGPVKNIDVSTITSVEEADASVAGFSAKDADRGFVVQCGEAHKVWFLAENTDARRTWVEGLILACNFEGKMTPTLMQEIMDLFIVETELELLKKQMETRPAIPPRPDNLDFVNGPMMLRGDAT